MATTSSTTTTWQRRSQDLATTGSSAAPEDDTVFGDDGDDWLENGATVTGTGGGAFNLLQGDNGAPFQDDPNEPGHDVLIGYGGETDNDAEGGDDVMLIGPGIQRNEGMLGFDYATHDGDPAAADSDLDLTGLLPPSVETNKDRFDLVEALSGWNLNDTLRGDDRDAAAMVGHELHGRGHGTRGRAQHRRWAAPPPSPAATSSWVVPAPTSSRVAAATTSSTATLSSTCASACGAAHRAGDRDRQRRDAGRRVRPAARRNDQPGSAPHRPGDPDPGERDSGRHGGVLRSAGRLHHRAPPAASSRSPTTVGTDADGPAPQRRAAPVLRPEDPGPSADRRRRHRR